MALIEVEDVERTFDHGGQRVVALHPVRFRVERGEFVVVTGESGAGKSTLLSLIGALDRPDRGRITVAGMDLTSGSASALADFRLRHIGFVFQDFRLLRHLTALGNVRLPLLFANRRRDIDRAEALLRRFDLAHRRTHRPGALSRGELQRVALARALVNDPRLLLLDEPTANLDARNAGVVWDHLAELNRRDGLTILAVTHNRNIASGATRVITLDNGAIAGDEQIV